MADEADAWRAETLERVHVGVRNAVLLSLLVTPFFFLLDETLLPALTVPLGACRLAVAGGVAAVFALLNDILDFSKVEAGGLDLDARAFAVRAAVDDVVRTFAGLRKPVAETELVRVLAGLRVGAADAVATLPTPPALAGRRVLVVEDDAVNRALIVRLLERCGVAVVAVIDGARAVAALDGDRFDAVLMDVEMPALDGCAATQAIRERGHAVPVVAVTAHAGKSDEERCRAAGLDAFVVKPIDVASLYATLERFVPAAAASAGAAASGAADAASSPTPRNVPQRRQTSQ